MDAYVAALQEAMEVVRDITGSPDLIIHAACLGRGGRRPRWPAIWPPRGDAGIHAITMMVAVLSQAKEGTMALFLRLTKPLLPRS